MGDVNGFLKVGRQETWHRPVCERIKDYRHVVIPRSDKDSCDQASRCMDCGTPFCNWGCPIGNYIPEWNDLMFRGQWKKAFKLLDATNNLPEITGRVCPAPCEYSCVLGINDDAVTIRDNELAIIEHAFKKGYIFPRPPKKRTGKKVAVIGSGPAGLSTAVQLNRAGHNVTVFERDKKSGGILRYGIPDFKLEKWIIDRRIKLMKREGVKFINRVNVGIDYPVTKLRKNFDAVCMTGGSRVPRDIKIRGRKLKGIYFAMDYLILSNMYDANKKAARKTDMNAFGKKVVVIGGGDTGADCVGVAHRQGASCVTQIELLPKPSECRTNDCPWPRYPMLLKTSTSHEEGGQRKWAVLTKEFLGKKGHVNKLSCVLLESPEVKDKTCPPMREVPDSEFEIEADLVIIAAGFLHPEKVGLLEKLDIELDKRGNVKADSAYMTSQKGIFSAGDMRRGQSLIVWAISEGRRAAHFIDKHLMDRTQLPCI